MSLEINRFDPVPFPHEGRSVTGRVSHRDRIQSLDVDAAALAAELRSAVRGEVRFDDGARALYATDASNYRQIPIGVVIPRDADDVVAAVALARRYGAPVLGRGAGTSLAGQCCNVAVVLDMSKYMHRIAELDPVQGFARVEPGIVLDDLRREAEKHHLTFGPDPATHAQCTLGGMIGNNSCGVHSIMSGKTVDNIEELEVLTYDGLRMRVGATSEADLRAIVAAGGRRAEIYSGLLSIRDRYADLIRARFPKIARRVSGYNLDELLPEKGFHVARSLVGSESTCALVLEAKTRLVHSPPVRSLVVLGYPTVYEAADDVPGILGFGPIGLEGFDDLLVRDQQYKGLNPKGIALLPPGGGWLLVEFGGETAEEAGEKAMRLVAAMDARVAARVVRDAHEARLLWAVRESGLGSTAHVPGKPPMWEGWEDAAVAPEKLGGYLRDLRALLGRYGYSGDFYGHFGDGCVHTRTDFDMTSADGIAKFRSFIFEAADLVASYGGSFSGEHGDGQARAELLEKMFGPELIQAFREFRRLWDPDGKMNPGKKAADVYAIDENLRLGAAHRPWAPETHFRFAEDGGRMNHAVLRCVGVGRCRRLDGGTMCPSYQVTREEEHSTRGRARLLFEMFKGEAIPSSWRNEAVKEALDLCVACKGCKGDCPTHVDMASWKAEFLSHYYEGRLRPLPAYSMGLIWWWAGIASLMPRLANAMMGLPMAKSLGGVAAARQMPRFAPRTFRQQFRPRPRRAGRRVLLWPDTFNNHFLPRTAIAAVEVLESAGFEVVIPSKRVCCGRPLYDWGFLTRAKKVLRRTLDVLRPELEEGLPVIGLEPSCVSVFRDELPALFPDDPLAGRLSSSAMMLSEFVALERDRFAFPPLRREALVQAHCHHKAVMKFDPEEAILRGLGLDLTHPDSGCCGMAGAFGFEERNFDVSMKIGERVLLPLVRAASDDALVIADGFSCREQIEQGTGRKTLHFAEVLKMALEG